MASEFRSQYKVGVVLGVEPCGKNEQLKACQVTVDDGAAPITVVTAASNVREGSRLAVAPVGSKIIDESGAERTIQRIAVGGVMSEGMFCDSRMLGWIGGAENIAAQMPATLAIGAAPPATKPRGGSCTSESIETTQPLPSVDVKPLFEKKLTKEEKKKLAEEKRKAKKAAKEANQGKEDETDC